ncbi:hypothetical protein VaNZ11_012952 [Volvox africanus]|uniref:VWFA domain-containing protein n=1 Tax=Volvox africanus TaxID=51714 RepID=A0ABQ5SF11_9CHLO|nr:hypothetical protein VaNZ11_012952 [Volvox africanus]
MNTLPGHGHGRCGLLSSHHEQTLAPRCPAAASPRVFVHPSHCLPSVMRGPSSHTVTHRLHNNKRTCVAARAADGDKGSSFSFELMGPAWSNRARLSEMMLNSLVELPGTRGMMDLRTRADDLATWKLALQKGTLPRMDQIEWPQEPFRSKFAEALRNLEMPRFTRRYPAVLDTLIKQMLSLAFEFEEKLAAAEQQQQQQQQQRQQQQQMPQPNQGQEQDQQQQQQTESQMASAAGGAASEQQQPPPNQPSPMQQEISEEELQKMMQQAIEQAQQKLPQEELQQNGNRPQLQIKMQDLEGENKGSKPSQEQQTLESQLERIADDIVRQFEADMSQVMENLEAGEMAFDDLNALLDGDEGFDLTRGVWRRTGWRELSTLREVLEKVPELRELVRQLGRGGGRGPLRRAPEELEARGYPPGVIRSPLRPEEVRGLTRSGDLSRMLPSEMALLAHGWPRKSYKDKQGQLHVHADAKTNTPVASSAGGGAAAAMPSSIGSTPATASASGGGTAMVMSSADGTSASLRHEPHIPVDVSVSSGEFDLEEYYLPGSHAARALHRVRRAERMLLSYDRTGWLDDEPACVTSRMEIRPAAELGPIILCLDTSGSMRGARETVAKALALECLRGAHRQRRACYLYAFSGPNEVQELQLSVDLDSLDSLLAFLSCSFMGGTDVDAPLKLSLERLAQKEWSQADILMVTDGEIPNPDEKIIQAISQAHTEMGLEVHGLLVSSHVTEAMRKLCTDVHVFKSWTAVPGGNDYMYH